MLRMQLMARVGLMVARALMEVEVRLFLGKQRLSKRLLGLVIIVVWQCERVMRAAVDKTVQFVVRVGVQGGRLRLGLERPRGRVGIEHVARGRDEQL